ncbi:MAG TPA: amidohydrolase [Thermoclostridium sp.]|nr:amidohydrolase [Clostridiaceae bacterium]HOQ76072.1 amidohydrolase [Thermoclostridium sp.]HPU45001.1 amidohydrolase [Thermoclostridium sp.]
MLIIKNAKILTMADIEYDSGYVACREERIAAVGPMKECPEPSGDDTVIDAAGMVLMPGLVDAHCHIGMVEDGTGFEGDDVNETADPVTPHLRAIDGINQYDRAFEEARQFGVTTVVTGPGSSNVIGGQFTAIKTWGRTVDEMIIKDPCAMKIAFGENPKTVYNEKHQAPTTRMTTAAILREQLFRAREYLEAKEEYERDREENEKPDFDMKLEALLPVIKRELVVKAHAHRADDIITAIRIAREFNLDLTLDHCTEGWLIADVLRESGYDVIVGPLLTDRCKPELRNQSLKAPAILANSGIRVSIMSDHPCVPVQHLMLSAALSVREGMDSTEALKAITINAARACRIHDRVGSLEVGKDADMVLYTGHPFDYMTRVYMTIINGKIVYTQGKG